MQHRVAALFAVFLIASCTYGASARPEKRTVKARVIVFSMDEETGLLHPRWWRQADEWPDLLFETEENLSKALKQTEDDRKAMGGGAIVMRALDGEGKVIYRGILLVAIWRRYETYGVPTAQPVPPEKVKAPTVTVVVPIEAKRLRFDGWLPLTKTELAVDEIITRYPNRDCEEE